MFRRGKAFARRRAMRRERVVAICGLLDRFTEYVSLASRIVFHHPDDGIIGRRLCDVAEELDFGTRRVDRAMRDVASYEYIASAERAEWDDETARYRGFAAIRQFTHKLISDLGLAELWEKWGKAHYRRQKKRQQQQAQRRPAPMPRTLPARRKAAAAGPVRLSAALGGKLGPPG